MQSSISILISTSIWFWETSMNVSTSLTPGDQLPALLERVARREKAARNRGLLYTALPVALTIGLFVLSQSSIRSAQQQVIALKAEAATFNSQIDTLKKNTEGYKSQSQ